MPIAQTEAVADSVTKLLSDRSDTVFLLCVAAMLLVLYVWKIVIPDREAKRKMQEKQQEITEQQAKTLAEICRVSTSIESNTTNTYQHTAAIVNVLGKFVECIRKATEQSGVDISDELSEMRGMLSVVRKDK